MINRLAKAQKSWIAKFILILTALSFMSLFGVSSYLGSAGSNRTVVQVDGIEISQNQFSYLLQRELEAARNLMDSDAEISDDMRTAFIYNQAQKMVQEAVLDRTAQKYHVVFAPALIRNIILNQPGFRDASGNFNKDMLRRILSEGHITESEFVDGIKRDMVRRLLIELPVQNMKAPEALRDAEAKVDNKRRTFKYVNIKPADVEISRQISEEEIAQYYEDFSSNFIEPERRNLSVFYLSMPEIAARTQIRPEDISAYYEEHKSEYETPETRNILQMMFEDEKEANKAFFELQSGSGFYEVAERLANQSREDTALGYVAEDELMEEIGAETFELPRGGFTKPVQMGEMWQIMQVDDIKPGSKVPYEEAAAKIREEMINEQIYDESYAVMGQIEDKLGAGEDLAAIAAEFGTPLLTVGGLADEGTAKSVPQKLAAAIKAPEFIDAAFSYTAGEMSQVLETDEGLAVIRVDSIAESHPKPMEDVRGEIKQLWLANEKTAVAQETLNDVMHDLENGDNLSEVGKRYGLKVYNSQPVTRNETFANINYNEIREMFAEPLATPRQIQQGDNYIVAVSVQDFENSVPLSEAEQEIISRNAAQSLMRDLAEALLSSYADDYKIRVKYKLMGIDDI